MLQPLVRAGQDLFRAINSRRAAEQLKHSFPIHRPSVLEGVETERRFPHATTEVVDRVNSLVEDYNEHLKSSEKNFRDAEAEFATKHFRFPSRIATQVRELHKCLSELGRLVNEGFLDKADLQLARFRISTK